MRSSSTTSAIRTKPSPAGPKPIPGETETPASSMRRRENSSEPRWRSPSGMGAQANMLAWGVGNAQPASRKEASSASRRRL